MRFVGGVFREVGGLDRCMLGMGGGGLWVGSGRRRCRARLVRLKNVDQQDVIETLFGGYTLYLRMSQLGVLPQ
jgi:hypothetical protein